MGAISTWLQGGLDVIIPPKDMLTREAGYDEEEAEAILEQAQSHIEQLTHT